jgi:putative Ca2+/H+ antiporter (TMEM165/GDT1 family)
MDLALFLSAFGIIALAELGDKTQLAAITLCCRHKPFSVFIGAVLGLILVNGIGVLIGDALAALLPIYWIGIGAGIVFIVFGLYILLSKDDKQVKTREGRYAILTSFSMVTLMELGDKTQLAVIALTAKAGGSFLIFLGASLAFLVVTGIGVTIGAAVQKVVPMRYIRIGAAIVFIIFGALFLLSTVAGFELLL